MPEIKNQFTGGKMNKDVDERLVPKGEYRDAMNIQVSTSEGSDVGTVQNILGNTKGCEWDMVPEGSFTVGSISDEKNDTLYWLVSGNYSGGVSFVDWSEFSSVSDMIIRHTGEEGCEVVFVDQFAFTVANNTSNNWGGVTQLSGLPVEVSSQIEPGWTVTGLTVDGDTSNTVEVSSVTPSPIYTANQNYHPDIYGSEFIVPLDSSGAMQAGNVLYVADYDPSISMGWYDGKSVRLFQNTHPDDQTHTIATGGAQIVNLTIVNVQPFPQAPLYQSVSYLKLTLSNNMTPFGGSFASKVTSGGTILSSSYDGSMIWGSLNFQPVPHNLVTHAVSSVLQPGDPISFGGNTGCVGYVYSSTLFTMVDCSTIDNAVPTPIQLPNFSFSFTLPLQTTILLDATLNLNTAFPLHETLIIEKPRVLNFNGGDFITGINIVDDMLFWTDGKTEPKKINIPRSIEGTQDFSVDANGLWSLGHTRLMVEGVDKGPIKEEHITVIRKAPLKPPRLEIKTTTREGITSGEDVVTINTPPPLLGLEVGNEKWLEFTDVSGTPFGFKNGDIMLLSDDIFDLPDNWKVRVSVKTDPNTPTPGITKILVKILAISPLFSLSTPTSLYGHLEEEKGIFQRKLPRFAYRYKYEDGEYSSFSPFTQAAFVPKDFNYQPIKAYNKGMVNSIKSLKIQNFVTPDIPLDVIGIDLLYKNEASPSVYLLKSISPNDIVLEGETTNYWNNFDSPLSTHDNKGSYEVSSENINMTLPSSQSLRVWDNVPKRALAQEITGNRIVYGNYTQGYDSIQPDVKAHLDSRAIDVNTNIGERSVKSLRDYNIGVVWGDKYGRETPVKSSGSPASVTVPKSRSASSNYISVSLKNSPDWAEYYRVYIKETSSEYYNLAVDRIYDADDGNIWVSFPSVDRNKVDEDTYIILKKGVESSELVGEEARYKIVAIENEAPEYIKTSYELLTRTNTDDSRPSYSCNMYGGSNTGGCSNLPGGGRNAPVVGMKGFSIDAGMWLRDYSTVHTAIVPTPTNPPYCSPCLGMQLTSPVKLLAEVSENASGSTTDELYVSFSKEVTSSEGVTIVTPSTKYHVVGITDEIEGRPVNDYSGCFYIHLDTPIVSVDEWVTEHLGDATSIEPAGTGDNIHIHFWKKTIVNKPEFDGRFFVKILGGDEFVAKYLKTETELVNDLMISTATSIYKIEDAEAGNFQDAGDYLYNPNGSGTSPQSASNTNSKTDWEGLLKFGGSSPRGAWFIDKATFASRQDGAQSLPDNGELSYLQVTTGFNNPAGSVIQSCDTWSPLFQTFEANCWSFPTDGGAATFWNEGYTIAPNIGTGNSLAKFGMKGVHQVGTNKYIDLAYSQLGPSADIWTGDLLDWRVGDAGNTSSDEELEIVANLKPNTRFRLNGGDVVYKIQGVYKHRLFNYKGKMTLTDEGIFSPLCIHNYFTNSESVSQHSLMGNMVNRRLTYRIKYEIDDLFTPDGTSVTAIDEDPAYSSITNTTSASLQFLTDYTVDGENPISADPAIFETEPKDEVDIDIYYEASSSLATFPLTDKNKYLFIPVGSTIVPPVGTDFPEGIFITSWEPINPFSPQYIINLSTELHPGLDYPDLTAQPLVYVEKDNGEIVSFKVVGFTQDPVTFMLIALEIEPEEEVGLSWFNCWSFNNGVESNRIGDTFNKPFLTNGATASTTTEELKEQEHRKNGLIYSGIYNSTSGVNNLNQFIAAEAITKDINPVYGSIQKLYSGWGQGGDLVALCEDRVLKILANKDALFNADGNPQLTATSKVLGQAIPYSGEYGISKNPESFASEAYRIYFTDKVRGTVMRLSMDGLTPISNHGMKDWFRDNLKWSDKLIGSYDDRKDEYNVALMKFKENDLIPLSASGDGPKASTVTFREDVKGWVSFKSFAPENAISCANEYYTFKEGKLWLHHYEKQDRNTFYGIHNSKDYSTFTTVLNDQPGIVKSFNTINYEGSDSRVTVNLLDNQYYNLSPKPGWYVDSLITNKESGSLDEFIEKEGKWFNYIKGKNPQHAGENIIVNPDGSSTFDHASFAIQGIGRLGAAPVNIATQGCMDSTAFNFNSNATQDDGSCIPFVFGCLHPSANNYDSSANTDGHNCTWTGCTCLSIGFPNGCINTTTFPIEAVGYPVPGPMPIPAVGIVDDGSCTAVIYGCTDPLASNYNSAANTNDGSCVMVVNGCMVPTASNYDSSVTNDNGTCIWFGCQDSIANNYYQTTGWASQADSYVALNSSYGLQPAACTYDLGCTDSSAVNYDSTATTDDGSCAYCTWPSNEADIFTVTSTDETVDGAGDGSITITANASFLDYGFGPIFGGSGAQITIFDASDDSVVIINASPQGLYLNGPWTWSGLDDGDYYITYTQGATTFVGSQTDPCIYTSSNNITIAAGAPAPVLGCTDSNADNYDSTATVGDGSCTYTISGCTDSTADNFDSTATSDDGSCAYTVYGCPDSNAQNYYGSVPANTTLVNDSSCYYAPGCTDPTSLTYWTQGFTADYDDGSCSLTSVVFGCTDSTQFNYDASANVNATSSTDATDPCISFAYGCTDATATNYDASANTDDGSCSYCVDGCTDSLACNYDSLATCDDGSCSGTAGCTDSTMFNYDSLATCDNGTCNPCETYSMSTFIEPSGGGFLQIRTENMDYGSSTSANPDGFGNGNMWAELFASDGTSMGPPMHIPGSIPWGSGFSYCSQGNTICPEDTYTLTVTEVGTNPVCSVSRTVFYPTNP